MDTAGPDDRDLLDLALRLADLLVRQQADRAATLGREAKLTAQTAAAERAVADERARVGALRSEVETLRAERDEAYRRIAELEDAATRPMPAADSVLLELARLGAHFHCRGTNPGKGPLPIDVLEDLAVTWHNRFEHGSTGPVPGPTRDELLDTALQDAQQDPMAWRDRLDPPD